MPTGFVIENGILKKYRGTDSHVVIPDSVTALGDYAFHYCSDLRYLTIPDSVVEIGMYTFQLCRSLTVICPRGSYAWKYCTDFQIPVKASQSGRPGFLSRLFGKK